MSWVRRNRFKALIILVAVLAIIGFAIRGRRHGEDGEAAQGPAPVDAVVIEARSMTAPLLSEAPGTVAPRNEADVAAKVMSAVAAVYVREGDRVSAGQILARLESADLDAQVDQASAALRASRARASTAATAVELQKAQSSAGIATARAALDAAKQQLAIAQSGPRPQERSQAKLAVTQAEAQARNAEAEYGRMQRLFDQDVVPRQRLDSAQTAFDVAKAQLETAREQANMVEEGSRREEIRAAEARVSQAEESLRLAQASVAQNRIRADEARSANADTARAAASLRYARVTSGYAVVRSPISGLVTRRMVDPGDMAQPGAPLLRVEAGSDYRLEATVPESHARALFTGRPVEVRLDDAGGNWLRSRVVQVIPAADRNSRSFVVKVSIPAEARVRSGSFGRLRFETGRERGLFVPREAIVERNGLTGIYIVDASGTARYRIVKLGGEAGSEVRALAGLSEGDRVIVTSGRPVVDGTPVRERR